MSGKDNAVVDTSSHVAKVKIPATVDFPTIA